MNHTLPFNDDVPSESTTATFRFASFSPMWVSCASRSDTTAEIGTATWMFTTLKFDASHSNLRTGHSTVFESSVRVSLPIPAESR